MNHLDGSLNVIPEMNSEHIKCVYIGLPTRMFETHENSKDRGGY